MQANEKCAVVMCKKMIILQIEVCALCHNSGLHFSLDLIYVRREENSLASGTMDTNTIAEGIVCRRGTYNYSYKNDTS